MSAAAGRRGRCEASAPMVVLTKAQSRDQHLPRASHSLRSISSINTFEDTWGFRRPLGMYNVSVDALPRLFIDVLDSFEAIRNEPLTGSVKLDAAGHALQTSHKALLYAMFEYLEDCDNIAKAFFPKATFNDKHAVFRSFRGGVKPYRDRLGRIVNAMKHRQARIGLFHAENSMLRISGYSIQTVIAPNTIGSDPEVHKKLRPTDVAATSFSHELRWLFASLYAVGEHLARFIDGMTGEALAQANHESSLSDAAEKALVAGGRPTFFDIGFRIAQIPGFVFPQEVRHQIPVVQCLRDKQSLEVGFSDNVPGLLTFGQLPGGAVRLTATYTGDGATTSFKVP